jgi:hypothetical protein
VTYTYSNASKVWKAVPVYPTLTAGRVLLGDGTSTPATDTELTYDATKNNLTVGGTVVMGSQFGFRNILINGDMRINQRGVTIAAATVGAYGPDRWKKTAGGMTQIVESGNFKANTVYTLSGTGVTTQQITSPNTGDWTLPDIPITATNIQLEEGTIATPFERRPYGLELQLCQRYCYLGRFANACAAKATQINAQFSFPVPMRASPTVASYPAGTCIVTDVTAGADFQSTNMGSPSVAATPIGAKCDIFNFSSLTPGRYLVLYALPSTGIIFDAEV